MKSWARKMERISKNTSHCVRKTIQGGWNGRKEDELDWGALYLLWLIVNSVIITILPFCFNLDTCYFIVLCSEHNSFSFVRSFQFFKQRTP